MKRRKGNICFVTFVIGLSGVKCNEFIQPIHAVFMSERLLS